MDKITSAPVVSWDCWKMQQALCVSLGIQPREAPELRTRQELENGDLQDYHRKWWHSQEEKGTRSVDFTSTRRKTQESAIQSTNHVHKQ